MTASVIGCGESAKDWFNNPCDFSIGVNDCKKWGHDPDYLVLIDSKVNFKFEPDRLKTIQNTKAKKVFCHGPTWREIFPNYEFIRLQTFNKYLKKGHVYCSKSSPFVAVSLAFNMGATDIMLYGCDYVNHHSLKLGTRVFDYEMRNWQKFASMLRENGTQLFVIFYQYMSHALLTVDRGDRKPMFDHCLWQASRFVSSYDRHILITRLSKSIAPDLTERFKEGYDEAVKCGVDFIIVIESDDWYHESYTHQIAKKFEGADFIGSEFTFYHHLGNRTWEKTHHPNHSSLFCTAFRVSAMKDFKWHTANKVFLDLDIWRYARKFRRSFLELPAIGIKGHNFGLTAGKGHRQVMANKDPDLSWLKARVDEKSFEFYKSL
jgi:hypothetical protein